MQEGGRPFGVLEEVQTIHRAGRRGGRGPEAVIKYWTLQPYADVEIDPARTRRNVKWGVEGNSCNFYPLGTTKGGINDRNSHDHHSYLASTELCEAGPLRCQCHLTLSERPSSQCPALPSEYTWRMANITGPWGAYRMMLTFGEWPTRVGYGRSNSLLLCVNIQWRKWASY